MKINGLSSSQVAANRKKFGLNILPKPKLKTPWDFLADVFTNKLNLILVALAVMFIIMAIFKTGEIIEAVGIIFVLVLIAAIDVITGIKSQKHTKYLENLSAVRYCNVIRDGEIHRIDTTQIVVDDIVMLNVGDAVYADGYLIQGEIEVDNSVLNGESDKVRKTPVSGYKYSYEKKISGNSYVDKNSLFAGTVIVSGVGKMQVKRIGCNTENGKIMNELQDISQPKTALEIKLDELAIKISKFGLWGAIIIGCILLFVQIGAIGGLDVFMGLGFVAALKSVLVVLAIALTILAAAVPEGLPLIVSLVISQNAKKMVRNHILAKYPNKIPEAGNLQILCTDKTGTLTYGNITPVSNFLGDGTEIKFNDNCPANDMFFMNLIANTGVSYDRDGNTVGGTATSRALFTLVGRDSKYFGVFDKKYNVKNVKVFDSADKYSATQLENKKTKETLSFYMGAPEKIISMATMYIDDKGKVKKLNKKIIDKIIKDNANRAMRMIATAYSNKALSKSGLVSGLTLLSVAALRDDIRPDVPAAVESMHDAKIQVIMITGDILETATAIAKECKIVKSEKDDIIVDASQLDKWTDAELMKKLPKLRVVARAVPTTKMRLVAVAQKAGLSIGMCGDGTNDAPALKKADIGFSMGSGTDVAKAAGDIIITDDNFVSVTYAVLLGRTFMHNIIMFLRFQLPINIWLMLTCLMFPLFVGKPAFWATQILAINIIMDSLNSLAFGNEPTKSEYMKEMPIKKDSSLISGFVFKMILFSVGGFALLFAVLNIPVIMLFFNTPEFSATARYVLLIFAAILNGFHIRTKGYNLFDNLSKNMGFVWIAILIFAGTYAMVQFAGSMFHVVPMDLVQWLIIFAVSILIIPYGYLVKYIMTKFSK